ncbi:MAG TPA: serine dehydratase beta chain, partial [Granulicella sp.]
MNTSLFELFKIGIGPSSSHTVGPMRAALRFARELTAAAQLDSVTNVCVELYGSLALTGLGHATDRAILLGLSGYAPDSIDPAHTDDLLATTRRDARLLLNGTHAIAFRESDHLLFLRDQMYPPPGVPTHPNGLRLSAFDAQGSLLREAVFYSIGGGFILSADEFNPDSPVATSSRSVPHPFASGDELLTLAASNKFTIADLVMANEVALLEADRSAAAPSINRPSPLTPSLSATPQAEIEASIIALFETMRTSAERGIATAGIL